MTPLFWRGLQCPLWVMNCRVQPKSSAVNYTPVDLTGRRNTPSLESATLE